MSYTDRFVRRPTSLFIFGIDSFQSFRSTTAQGRQCEVDEKVFFYYYYFINYIYVHVKVFFVCGFYQMFVPFFFLIKDESAQKKGIETIEVQDCE